MLICILCQRHQDPDEDLARIVGSELRALGHTVFLDEGRFTGLPWVQHIEAQIRQADLVVPLLSAHSVQSEMLVCQVEMADQAARQQGGWPELMPVRLHFKGALPDELGALLTPLEFEWDAAADRYRSHATIWNSPADDRPLVMAIAARLERLAARRRLAAPALAPAPARQIRPLLEPIGGAMALNSGYYVERPTDGEFHAALRRHESLVLVKGARQMGKTSLLGRGLQRGREHGFTVVLTDFQKLQASQLASLTDFYAGLCELVAQALGVDVPLPHQWHGRRSPNLTFEEFWRYDVLEKLKQPVLWACDEFDRLLATGFSSEVCGLLRAWHNERVLEPDGGWSLLTIAIAYATEAQLFIRDLNQSPFNVGTRLTLADFTIPEVTRLNELYARPLKDSGEVHRFYALLAGQPYLSQCAFHHMSARGEGVGFIERQAELEDGIFADHLRRLLVVLTRDAVVTDIIRALLQKGTPPPLDQFHRLRSGGAVSGSSPEQAQFRCDLYRKFLQRHLL